MKRARIDKKLRSRSGWRFLQGRLYHKAFRSGRHTIIAEAWRTPGGAGCWTALHRDQAARRRGGALQYLMQGRTRQKAIEAAFHGVVMGAAPRGDHPIRCPLSIKGERSR